MSSSEVTCSDCGQPLPNEPGKPDVPCEHCGSTKRTVSMSIEDGFRFFDAFRGQAKRPDLPSDKKLRWDSFSGFEYSHSLKKLVKKVRTIDRDTDSYVERVTDPDTGEVIHECVEPLSQHSGHGSAKNRGKK